ncbi:MAG: PTS transporter subunit EIIA [Anaerolineales bacterium]|nr:PTS transporter subunit EIIA [Anaerolineales bacterium]
MDLRELLRLQLADVKVSVNNWEDAVRAAGDLLVKDDAVEPRFIEAMIQVAKDLGPYIVIAPGIALPHARPEDGVKRTSISMITLTHPVEFGNEFNDPIHLVVALAATDHEQHVNGLADLAKVLSKEDNVERLKTVATIDELIAIMLEGD